MLKSLKENNDKLSRLLQQAGAKYESLSGGVGVCDAGVVVINNVYPLRLAQFLKDEKTYCNETSCKHTS